MARLNLAVPFDPVVSKELWLGALDDAEAVPPFWADRRGGLPSTTLSELERFTAPDLERDLASQGLVPHFGTPGGVLPRVAGI